MLINCVETDSSAEVRKLALSKLSLSHKADVLKIIYRVDDVSEKVRMEAYKVLSKLHLKQFTIEFRKKLLYTGLYDNNGRFILLHYPYFYVIIVVILNFFIFRYCKRHSKNSFITCMAQKNGW